MDLHNWTQDSFSTSAPNTTTAVVHFSPISPYLGDSPTVLSLSSNVPSPEVLCSPSLGWHPLFYAFVAPLTSPIMTCMHSFIHSADTLVATHYKPSVKLDSRNNVAVKIEHEVYTVVGEGIKAC